MITRGDIIYVEEISKSEDLGVFRVVEELTELREDGNYELIVLCKDPKTGWKGTYSTKTHTWCLADVKIGYLLNSLKKIKEIVEYT